MELPYSVDLLSGPPQMRSQWPNQVCLLVCSCDASLYLYRACEFSSSCHRHIYARQRLVDGRHSNRNIYTSQRKRSCRANGGPHENEKHPSCCCRGQKISTYQHWWQYQRAAWMHVDRCRRQILDLDYQPGCKQLRDTDQLCAPPI